MGTAFSCAVNFYASVVTFCRVGARRREDGRGWNQSLWLYSCLRHRYWVMISINEAIAPLQCVGGGSERRRRLLFSPIRPGVRPSLEIQPKNGATSPSLPSPLQSSSNPLPPLLHYARARDARAGRRGNLASSQNRAELIGKLQGSAVAILRSLTRAHPLLALPHFQQNSTTSLAHTSTSIPSTASLGPSPPAAPTRATS